VRLTHILIMVHAKCRYKCTCTRTRVHAKRISMPQMVGQLLVLRRRASENHKLGRSEVTGDGLRVVGAMGGEGKEETSPIRVQDASAFKVVALARYSVAKSRDAWFLLFPSYPFFSLRIDVPISRQATSDSWLSLGSRISPRLRGSWI